LSPQPSDGRKIKPGKIIVPSPQPGDVGELNKEVKLKKNKK